MAGPNGADPEDWRDKYRALEKEYDDFREQSQSLERELEMDVDMLEKNNKELKSKNNQLQFDLDTLRVSKRSGFGFPVWLGVFLSRRMCRFCLLIDDGWLEKDSFLNL